MGSLGRPSSPISVIIKPASDPIAGSISWQGQAELEFYGWLELLVVLDVIHRGEPTDHPCDPTRES